MYDDILRKLERFFEQDRWSGNDPYDGLNSPILKVLTFDRKWLRIAAIQFMKRSPINFRPLLGIPRTKNPKALGVLANAYLLRYKTNHKEQYLDKAREMLDWLIANPSPGYSGYCWGYNFDWQSSVFYLPRGTPAIVNTSFIAHAFLDAYEITKDKCYLDVARSCCDFVLNDLNRTPLEKIKNDLMTNDSVTKKNIPSSIPPHSWGREGWGGGDPFCFSYSPLDKQCIHNANLFAAGLLARVYHFTGEDSLRRAAESSIAFSLSKQNSDGSWYYGHAKEETYIDNFHTGFVLVSLKNAMTNLDASNSSGFKRMLSKGYEYYKKAFFSEDGMPHYYSNRVYPIDLHCSAQGIITFIEFAESDRNAISMAKGIADWAIRNMWNDKKGCFHFQKTKFLTNKVPYLRWPNAWMFFALALLAQHRA